MSRDNRELLNKIEESIGSDFNPVRPLWSSARRALIFFPLWIGLIGVIFLVFGFRPDYSELGGTVVWALTLFQAVFAVVALWLALRFVVPGELLSNSFTAVGAGFGVVIHLLVSLLFDFLSPVSVPPEVLLRLNLVCLSMVLALSLTPFVVGAYLARRGLLIYPAVTGALLGLGSGLGAEAAWRMHCPISSWDHVLLSHTLGIVVAVMIGLGGGYLWKRKAG